MPVSL